MLRLLAIFSLLCFAMPASPQAAAELKEKGAAHIKAQQYKPALAALLQAEKWGENDAKTLTNIGICRYHLHQPADAEAKLYAAHLAKGKLPPANLLYLAKLNQSRFEFEKAAIFFKKYLKKIPAKHPWRTAVYDELRRCATGLRLRRLPAAAAVVPLTNFNSSYHEHCPLPSPNNPERLYFSAPSPTDSTSTDIFFSDASTGDWSVPQSIGSFVNSTANEAALGFGPGGAQLYFFRGKTQATGEILVDTFRENPLEKSLFFEPFDGPMRPAEGDVSAHFFNDSILLFASRRPGGLGGLDLYVSTFTDGYWTPAKNLGPPVNTPYDETSPFLARDGRTLYFSSTHPERSMGGLDVLSAVFQDRAMQWSPPVNLGPPINSTADDEGFRLAANADRAFFSSDRLTSLGGHDLYLALFDLPREEHLGESWPVAFHLVPEGKNAKPTEQAVAGESPHFFDEISSFELPVMALPPLGGSPDETCVNQFAQLAQLLVRYPKLAATLAIHCAEGDSPSVYFRFASQTVNDLLRQEGVPPGRVALLFAGSSYPIAEGEQAENPSPPNRRAEVFVLNPTVLPFELFRPKLPARAFKAHFFQKTMNSLAYRVSVEVPTSADLAKLFELYPDGLVEVAGSGGGGGTSFSPGIYLTFASALAWQETLAKDGFQSAVVTAHLRGSPLSKTLAAKYVEDFPDLIFYLR
ncbi:MAG: hypothetical protein MUC59_08905 [Saprospiraceae bacterium]|nr:hypothetical protein [Saprospiraceae bacterium]